MAYKLGKTIHLRNGKSVGHLEGDAYRSFRKAKKHFFRSTPGWAISVDVLDLLAKHKVSDIILHVIADSGSYDTKANVRDFVRYGREIDYGDKQLLLPDEYWSQQRPEQLKLEEVRSEDSLRQGQEHLEQDTPEDA